MLGLTIRFLKSPGYLLFWPVLPPRIMTMYGVILPRTPNEQWKETSLFGDYTTYLLYVGILINHYMSVSRNGVYKIYDHMHVAFPRIIPRIMPPNHTTNHTHDFNKGGRNIPRNIPPKHTSETYLESYPLMQHALLGTEFSERAIYTDPH